MSTVQAVAPEPRPSSFRWKAFGVHLAISLLILAALLYLLFYYWFPGYLFDTDGGWQALRVIAGVDIILGPMLTLIAANPRKSARELRKDFAVIGLIQASALSVGTWLAWDNRPYALFWYDGVVYSMPWSAFDDEPAVLAHLREGTEPYRVTVDIPFDPLERSRAMDESTARGTIPLFDPVFYRPWPPHSGYLKAFETLALQQAAEADRKTLEQALASARQKYPRAMLVPTQSRYAAYFLLLNPDSGETLDTLRVRPDSGLLSGTYPGQWLRDEIRRLKDAQAAATSAEKK